MADKILGSKKATGETFEKAILVEYHPADKVAVVTLNRPTKMNALTFELFADFERAFEGLLNDAEKDVRAIVLTSSGQHFTAGLDLNSASQITQLNSASSEEFDTARVALAMQRLVGPLQRQTSIVEKCRVPVVCAMSGYVIGAGIDISSACDIRVCSKDAKFTIREIDIGMCADLGTI